MSEYMTASFDFKFPDEARKVFDNPNNFAEAAKAGFDLIKKDIPKNIAAKKCEGDLSSWPEYRETYNKERDRKRYIRIKEKKYGKTENDLMSNTGAGANPSNYTVVKLEDGIGILADPSIFYMNYFNVEDGEFDTKYGRTRVRRYLIWNKSTKRRFSNAFKSAIIKKLER